MKSLYININNEPIQSNDELEVLNYDLDSDFFFCLGERIAKGCKVENENSLITDFNTQDNAEDYQKIIAQWKEIKGILFGEECEGKYELTLPNGYIHWLRYNEKYNDVYDKNFSHGESAVITIDLEELYEDSVECLQRKILRKLQRDDFYLEIDEIVFNDDAVTRKSSIIRTIKDKYEGVGFKVYKKWLQDNDEKLHTTPQFCEKCGKNPCECNTTPISSNDFFPYKGFLLGISYPKEFEDWDFMQDNIVNYKIDDCVTLMGETKRDDSFIAAMVDSNNKLPKEWSNILGCRLGAFREKCRRALNKKGFEIILDEDSEIVVVSPSKKYRVHLAFDIDTSKFVAILITLNACPYCSSSNFALRKINAEEHISYCTDCDKSYFPFEVESEEFDDDTDDAGNQMSEYFDVFGLIVGKSTENDVRMKGGKIGYSGEGGFKRYVMPNNIDVHISEGVVSLINISHKSKESFPKFYENIGLHWGFSIPLVMSIFNNLGFLVSEGDKSVSAYKYCKKFNKSINFNIGYVRGNNSLYWSDFIIMVI